MNNGSNRDKLPGGIPFIIGNELAERFSYYGMKTILTVFMTTYLMNNAGQPDPMNAEDSKFWYHIFIGGNYFFPILGALLADVLWGKYKTIIVLSILYCLGHLALSMDETRLGLSLGLTMIAIGAGGIKPCVSANVGDQFNFSNQHLLQKVFNYFYLSINIGSMVSTILTPVLLRAYGPSVAFGVPGILMIIATIIFWLGRSKFVNVPPAGWKKYKAEVLGKEGITALKGLTVIYLFMGAFWSLWEQNGSSWVLQAMNPNVIKEASLFGYSFTILPDQALAFNPFFVIVLVPLFSFVVYPAIDKVFKLTSLRKISIGLFICSLSFVIVALMEEALIAGKQVSILWQCFAYFILTISEVMVYGTGLEFSYTQAPYNMKSLVMGFFLLSVTLGSFFTAFVNYFIQNADGSSKLAGASYFWFFVFLMAATAVGFIFVAYFYKEKTYVREDIQSKEQGKVITDII